MDGHDPKCANLRALPDAGYSGTLLSKDEESEPKELRMPQNINALLLCFAEQYEVMKNGIIQTGRFGLDGKV